MSEPGDVDPRVLPAIEEVFALLVSGQYEELARRSIDKRVRAEDMSRRIDEIGGQLQKPPDWGGIWSTPLLSEKDAWAVDVPLWTLELGRSDYEVRLSVTLNADGTYSYSVHDILMP